MEHKVYKFKFLAIILLLLPLSLFAQTTWMVDKAHSKVGFSVTHMVITNVEGYFKDYEAKITTTDDDFSTAQIDFIINTNSIFTDNERRDNHLRSDDFFNAEKYPHMIFKSKSIKKTGSDEYKLVGNFTIRDVTKQIELDVKLNGLIQDGFGNERAGFKITGEINRFDYNLKWDKTIETGGLIAGKEVELIINLELVRKL
jgi:polyisoprenoid-binding protein YceI